MKSLIGQLATPELAIIGIVSVGALILIIVFAERHRRMRRLKSAGLYMEALKELIRGNEDLAFHHLKRVVTQDTSNIDAYLKLGDIFRGRGEVAKALQIHRQLTVRGDLSPSDQQELLKSLALDYIESDKVDRAIATLQELLDQDKKNLWALQQLLRQYEKRAEWTQALDTQEAIFKITGQNDDGLLALYEIQIGHQLASQKEYHKARLKYKDALRLDKDCVAAYLGLGDAYQQEGRLEDAIDIWKELFVQVPGRAFLAFGKLEKALFEKGQYGEVVRLYRDLLLDDPDNTKALLALANIYEKKGDLNGAIEACQRALEIDPDFISARRFLVKLYGQRGDLKKVMAHIDGLLRSTSQRFTCGHCGYQSTQPRWYCPQCGQWRTFNL